MPRAGTHQGSCGLRVSQAVLQLAELSHTSSRRVIQQLAIRACKQRGNAAASSGKHMVWRFSNSGYMKQRFAGHTANKHIHYQPLENRTLQTSSCTAAAIILRQLLRIEFRTLAQMLAALANSSGWRLPVNTCRQGRDVSDQAAGGQHVELVIHQEAVRAAGQREHKTLVEAPCHGKSHTADRFT